MLSVVSAAFASDVHAPRGNPITQHVFTSDPASSFETSGTYPEFTQTDAHPYVLASSQIFTICSGVASAFKRVSSK